MPEEDDALHHIANCKLEIAKLADKVDKKALAGAVGVMLLSWAGLPIVYWLIARKKKENDESKKSQQKEKESHRMEEMHEKSKVRERNH